MDEVLITETHAEKDITSVLVRSISKLQVKRATTDVNLWNIPQRNTNFTGRDRLFIEIKERLQSYSGNNIRPVIITACHGLGGVGKTQLTLEYVYRYGDNYNTICWIPADNESSIEAVYQELARDMHLAPQNASRNEHIHTAKNYFEHHKCLLIFDNAPNYQILERYLPAMTSDVLITSRYTEWLDKGIQVDVFTVDEAREYVRKILGNRSIDNQENIDSLSTKMGKLPLALAQAAAYIRQNKMRIDEYLELYDTRKQELLSKQTLPIGDKHEAIYVTWDITMSQIQSKSPSARRLLNFCSFLHNQDIPVFLLNELINENIEELVGILDSYSMIKVHSANLSLHELVQEVVRLKLKHESQDKEYMKCIMTVLQHRMSAYDLSNLASVKIVEKILIHAEVIIKFFKTIEMDLAALEIIINAIVSYYLDYRQSISVESFCNSLLDIQYSRYGSEENLAIVKTINRLGELYYYRSDYSLAIEQFEKSLATLNALKQTDEVREKYAETMCLLADVIAKEGKFKTAEDMHRKAIAIQKEIYKDKANDNLAETLHALGNALFNQGFFSDAKKTFKDSFNMRKQCYKTENNDHPKLARTIHMLGQVYCKLGQQEKAQNRLKEALSIEERHHGKVHADVAKSYRALASLSYEARHYSEAQQYCLSALEIQEKLYPQGNHPQIGRTYVFMGKILKALNEEDSSILYYKKALSIFMVKLGEDHPDTRACLDAMQQNQQVTHGDTVLQTLSQTLDKFPR